MIRSCDVVVIGGGPAGSSIAARLAERGWHVELLEKTPHPRFHIGESLLPHSMPFLEKLGVLDEIDQIGLKKYGAELISTRHGRGVTLYFANALANPYSYAYQVLRSDFDTILLRNAVNKGARIQEGVRVLDVELALPKMRVHTAEGERGNLVWESRFVVDATGRDALLAKRLGALERDRRHNSAAIYNHFHGVKRLPGKDEGNITVCWFDDGWIWIIPLKNGVTSVGIVLWPHCLKARDGSLDDLFWQAVHRCPPVTERLKQATPLTHARGTGNFSYRSKIMGGEGFILLGDAFSFVDPVFSTGVHFALNSAIKGAEVVDTYLRGANHYHRHLGQLEKEVRNGLASISWFIYRFTQPAFEQLFVYPRQNVRRVFHMEQAVLSVLAGDIFKNATPQPRLWLFKLIYFVFSLMVPQRNFAAYSRRKRSVNERVEIDAER